MVNDPQGGQPALEGTSPVQASATGAVETPPQEEPTGVNRTFTLGVIGTSHALNHVQSGLGAVLFPVMMQQMGFSFFELGLLSSLYQLSAQGMQAVYGLLAHYYRRSFLLGIGNLIVGFGGLALGFTQSFTQVISVRVVAGAGSSVQHPVASAILASYFRKAKARVLAAHYTAGSVGSLIAPIAAVAMLQFFDWRTIWIVMAIPSILMGAAYFFFRDSITMAGSSKKKGTKLALSSYVACLKNRQVMMVSAIQMVGAAGRGTGIDVTYFVPFFMVAIGTDTTVAGLLVGLLQVGGLIGPMGVGWLADRAGQRKVLAGVMLLSAAVTVTMVLHSQLTIALLLNVLLYGCIVFSRSSLTQAMTADAVPDEHMDAAFSIYFFVGFISGPMWTALAGYLIDSRGFTTAFLLVSLTYIAGLALITFIKPRSHAPGRRTPAGTG